MQEHLTLRLVYLKSPAKWAHDEEGLAFVFPTEGTGHYACGRVVQRVAPGEVLVSTGGRGAELSAAGGGHLVFKRFSLSLEHLFPLFAAEEISLMGAVTDRLKGFQPYPASSALATECHRLLAQIPVSVDLYHRSHLLCLAGLILTEEFKAARTQRVGFVRAEDHLVQVLSTLSAPELLSLSVEDLADKFGCSRRHLSRLFQHHFGFSVAALRMDMRMLKAVSLLRNPDAKVINVAEQCGFNHLGLFNTCFKRRFGTSPGQWRKQASSAKSGKALFASACCPMYSKGLCPSAEAQPQTSKELHFMLPAPPSVLPGVQSSPPARYQPAVTA